MARETSAQECLANFRSEEVVREVDEAQKRQFEMARGAQERSENLNFNLLGSVKQFF